MPGLRSDAQALADLRAHVAAHPRPPAVATNAHVHCHHSFSVFGPPADAVRAAWDAGVEVLGLNDFFTTAAATAFAEACAVADLPGFLCVECIARDDEAARAGTLLNDPGNPGKVYLCAKGVTRPDDAKAQTRLAQVRAQQEARNRRLVEALDGHFRDRLGLPGPSWDQVIAQTPAGNTTERHVARAALIRLEALAAEGRDLADLGRILTGADLPPGDAQRQDHLRATLLKAGKPCYVPEDPAAFPSVAELRRLCLDLGAIPTYPILGNPVTNGEADLATHLDRVQVWGFPVVELITPRNTPERIAEALAAGRERGMPVTDGTEHNTPTMEPLITRAGTDPRFAPALREGALVILGHTLVRAEGGIGFIDEDGRVPDGAHQRCLARGRDRVGC